MMEYVGLVHAVAHLMDHAPRLLRWIARRRTTGGVRTLIATRTRALILAHVAATRTMRPVTYAAVTQNVNAYYCYLPSVVEHGPTAAMARIARAPVAANV